MSDITKEEAINILKQRQCCRECVADCKCEDCDKAFKMAIESLENQKTGHWIMPKNDDGTSEVIEYQVRCSECGFDLDPQTWHQELHQYGADKYCPNCGAKMERS